MDLTGKRAVLLAGHFMPEVGYFEVYLAKVLRSIGLEVLVITSDQVSPSKKVVVGRSYDEGRQQTEEGILVDRISPLFNLGAMLVAKGINKRIEEFDPDYIFVLGVGKIFPFPVFSLKTKARTLSFFGEMSDYYVNPNPLVNLKNWILKETIKRFFYNKAFRSLDTIVAYTPETPKILLEGLCYSWNKRILKDKIVESSLGYDSSQFYFNENERKSTRGKYGIEEQDRVLVTSTRVTATKRLEYVIDAVNQVNANGQKLYYFIIGFHDDAYGAKLKSHIESKEFADRIICLPFLDHDSIRKHYNASDYGVWTKAAISIQESMGTGISVLLEKRKSVAHLIDEQVNGKFYLEEEFPKLLAQMVSTERPDRDKVMEHNQRFSYQAILSNVLES